MVRDRPAGRSAVTLICSTVSVIWSHPDRAAHAGRLKGLTLIAPADLPPSYKGAGD